MLNERLIFESLSFGGDEDSPGFVVFPITTSSPPPSAGIDLALELRDSVVVRFEELMLSSELANFFVPTRSNLLAPRMLLVDLKIVF